MKDEDRVESRTRYSLIVSLRLLASVDVDIYTPTLTEIEAIASEIDNGS